jgi:hypothetical protein
MKFNIGLLSTFILGYVFGLTLATIAQGDLEGIDGYQIRLVQL